MHPRRTDTLTYDDLHDVLLDHPTFGTIEPLPEDPHADRLTIVVREIPDDWDFEDEPDDARDSLTMHILDTEFVLNLPIHEERD